MEGIEDNLFQMDSFDSSDQTFKEYSPKKGQESLKNIREDIPVTSDSSPYKNSTNDNASVYDNPRL